MYLQMAEEPDKQEEDEELKDAPDLSIEDDLFLLEIPKPAATLPFQGSLRIKTGKPAPP